MDEEDSIACIECGAEFTVTGLNEEVVDLIPTHCPYCGEEPPQYDDLGVEYGDDED